MTYGMHSLGDNFDIIVNTTDQTLTPIQLQLQTHTRSCLTLTPTHTHPYHTTTTTSYHIISSLIFSWRNGDSGYSVEHEKILKNAATELIEIVEHQAAAHLTGPVKNLTEPVKILTGPVEDLTEPRIMGELIRARDACLSLQQLRHLVNCVVIQGNFLSFYATHSNIVEQ